MLLAYEYMRIGFCLQHTKWDILTNFQSYLYDTNKDSPKENGIRLLLTIKVHIQCDRGCFYKYYIRPYTRAIE